MNRFIAKSPGPGTDFLVIKVHFWAIIPLLLDAVGDEGAPTRTNIIQKGAAVTAGQKGAAVTEDFYLKRQTQRKLVPEFGKSGRPS